MTSSIFKQYRNIKSVKQSYFLMITTAICAMFQLPYLQKLVIWNSEQIQSGQWWRIVTGHFTHTNTIHLTMNITALWAITYLFQPTGRNLYWILLSLAIAVGLSLFCFNFYNYSGLSGILHGVFAYYALSEALSGRKSSWLLVVGVIAKVTYEQLYGASESTARLIMAQVATEAHLSGTVSGILIAMIIIAVRAKKNTID